jgi:DNA-binding NarL/FixJ family response regulator
MRYGLSFPRILLADDHPNICKSVAALLEPDFEVVGIVANGRDVLSEARRLQPDVVILDISMPLMGGIEAAKQLRASGSSAKVMFLTVHDEAEFVRAGLASGAVGYVIKHRLTSDLIPAVREILAGNRFISPALRSPKEHDKKEMPR